MKSVLLGLIFVLSQLCLYSQSPYNTNIYKALPFSNIAVKLDSSWVKHREDLNTEYLKSLDPDRLLHNFKINAGLPSNAQPLEGWEAPYIGLRGHFVGHYLSALSNVVQKQNDKLLHNRLNYIVDELYKCQQALGHGYLSAFPEHDFDTLETKFGGVWAPYYTYHKLMQGLLDVFVRTNNKKAYDMVLGMASYASNRMAKLDAETIEKMLYTTEANPANEAGAMNEVLYKLYKISKDPQHLALAHIFDREWFFNPLSNNVDILSGLHSNTHLVLVNGFAERYSITKEISYRDAVVNFWSMLINNHAYANGSSSGPRPNVTTPTSLTSEHWGVPGHLSSTMTKEIAESCVSHNTQKLSATLFTWTVDPKFANAYMNTFYNSVLALQSAHTGACVYHLPLGSPRQKSFLKNNDFRCCNGSSIEAFSLLNSGIYYHSDSALWVNLYVPSHVSWAEKGFTLQQKGSFPQDSVVNFTVETKRKFSLAIKFLTPSWANNVDVYINNIKQNINTAPNSYISLNREWKNKDKIRLVFHYNFYIKSMPDDNNVIAIFYGPTLLAFDYRSELILKDDQADILRNLSVAADHKTFNLKNGGKVYSLKPLYEIEGEIYGVYATVRNY
ncbi:beta-L-arabinofuranosidase domain-containing protein [Ohtaekwangia sp.]|uniref:beta-L-arabinofuranosidase domain-containing protein n=1 Tax=Ohtaekwangia sp. TaxID=2066019 RepID=UPI002FDE8279